VGPEGGEKAEPSSEAGSEAGKQVPSIKIGGDPEEDDEEGEEEEGEEPEGRRSRSSESSKVSETLILNSIFG